MSDSTPPDPEEPQEFPAPGTLLDYVQAMLTSRSSADPALKAAASSLTAEDLSPAGLSELKSIQHQAAIEAVRLRADAALSYWGPLLPSCKDGLSSSPIADLKSLLLEVRALLAEAEGKEQDSLAQLANQLDGWIPKKSSVRLTASKFEAPVITQPKAAPKGTRGSLDPADSKTSTRRLLLLLALLVFGVLVARAVNRGPPPSSLQAYQEAVGEILEVRTEGDTLVVVVESSWARKDETAKFRDIDLIESTVTGEPINWIVVKDPARAYLAELSENGSRIFSP